MNNVKWYAKSFYSVCMIIDLLIIDKSDDKAMEGNKQVYYLIGSNLHGKMIINWAVSCRAYKVEGRTVGRDTCMTNISVTHWLGSTAENNRCHCWRRPWNDTETTKLICSDLPYSGVIQLVTQNYLKCNLLNFALLHFDPAYPLGTMSLCCH